MEARRGLWPVLLSSMNLKAEEFIENNLEAILPQLLKVDADNQVWQSYSFISCIPHLFIQIHVENGEKTEWNSFM